MINSSNSFWDKPRPNLKQYTPHTTEWITIGAIKAGSKTGSINNKLNSKKTGLRTKTGRRTHGMGDGTCHPGCGVVTPQSKETDSASPCYRSIDPSLLHEKTKKPPRPLSHSPTHISSLYPPWRNERPLQRQRSHAVPTVRFARNCAAPVARR